MELQLLGFGYEVTGIASTGKEALRLVQSTRPDLILMDVQLHGSLDGIATATEAQKISKIPVVFVTAFGHEETRRRAKAARPYGFLTKPYRPEDLRAVVSAALAESRVQRSKQTILIAEDDFLIREGYLQPLLEAVFTIVASVGDGRDAVAAAVELRPDIVLLDVSLPGLRGFEAARQILAAIPACKVLLVSNYGDRAYLRAAQELGASGYVLKSRAQNELLPAIETALAGQFYQSSL
jgi:DNA-binding NarL/FixJ family response regulator